MTKVTIADAPAIAGLSFRYFNGQADYAVMAEIYQLCMAEDQNTSTINADEMAFWYAAGTRYNPYRQLLFTEVAGTPVAFASTKYVTNSDGSHFYLLRGQSQPAVA